MDSEIEENPRRGLERRCFERNIDTGWWESLRGFQRRGAMTEQVLSQKQFVSGVLTPSLWCLSTAKFSLTPTGSFKNTSKYIADPAPLVLPQTDYCTEVHDI